jgi:hypothetical protein
MAVSTYPVHVEAHIDPHLSRWQWLFKWLLALPHYLVLVFLWIAFVVLSFVAFFAILFTGRYPRSIFDFNVGVLRWTWRVTYYAYGALGTDRYPPFSLAERADYPAHLEIEYPEHLSRGLVLVKWWLLAIPHYLVLSFFLGGAGYAFTNSDTGGPFAGAGLIGLLVLVAAVVLLFTGRYPKPVFDFVLGLNRWVLRVAAYAGLMTDSYPPFRLDQGGDDPTVLRTPPAPTAAAPGSHQPWPADPRTLTPGTTGVSAPGTSPLSSRWGVGRVIALVAGCVVLLGSVAIGLAGAGLAFTDRVLRDDDGYLMTDTTQLTTQTYAITSTSVTIDSSAAPSMLPERLLGDVKVTVHADVPIFVGIASTADARTYLGDVEHTTLTDFTDQPVYETSGTGSPVGPPADQVFWVAQASGVGDQRLTWSPSGGDWTLVLMNADGSRQVVGDVAVGATVPALDWLVPTLLGLAAVGLVVATVMVAVTLRGPTRAA